MSTTNDFVTRVERKIKQQLSSQRVGYLLGAGSSYLDGTGYPLASYLWDMIKDSVSKPYCTEIQKKLDEGANGLEHALDLLDRGEVQESHHRHVVIEAIANLFARLSPSLDFHSEFLLRLSRKTESIVPVFSLNYDPLIERAAEYAKVRIIDGFLGAENAYFDPHIFQQRIGLIRRGHRYPVFQQINGIIHLYKLHGSLGWFESNEQGVRRCSFSAAPPAGTKRLMIPPQWRKATETTTMPYTALWSELRAMLCQGPNLINRLLAIGYGMADEHVNAVIENGLARNNFILIIFSKILSDDIFERWSSKQNVIIVTADRSSIYGEIGPGHKKLWNFEFLSKEV
jgi:hypothetical protein